MEQEKISLVMIIFFAAIVAFLHAADHSRVYKQEKKLKHDPSDWQNQYFSGTKNP